MKFGRSNKKTVDDKWRERLLDGAVSSPDEISPQPDKALEAHVRARRKAQEAEQRAMRQEVRNEELRQALVLHQRRTRAMTLLVVLGLGLAITVFVMHNMRDPRSVGTQLDAAVNNVRDAGDKAGQKLASSANAAAEASQDAAEGVTSSLGDAMITAQVKTSLAADPKLKASKIDVTTKNGVVRLDGPAPDAASRDRAAVLAAAPPGVRGVDNQLALSQPGDVLTAKAGNTPTPRRNAQPNPAELLNNAPTAAGPKPASAPAAAASAAN